MEVAGKLWRQAVREARKRRRKDQPEQLEAAYDYLQHITGLVNKLAKKIKAIDDEEWEVSDEHLGQYDHDDIDWRMVRKIKKTLPKKIKLRAKLIDDMRVMKEVLRNAQADVDQLEAEFS